VKLTKVEKKEKNQVELSIVVEKEEFEKACEQSYRKNVGHINLQGFRKGKAPRKMIEKMYGPEIFYEDAMTFCYPDAYDKAVEEAGIEPIDQPNLTDFDIKDGEFSFVAVVPVKPEVEIKDYMGLEAEKETVKVTEKEVDAEIERLLERNARLVTVERAVENGDIIVFDFEGFVDGKAFDGGKAENYSLKIGSGMFIPGFEEQLIGKTAGEECDVNVTFPEDYQAAELAGKPAVFKCKVNEVKESQKPELDDEFVKDVSEFDTLDAFKADMKEKMKQNKQRRADAEFEEKLMEKMLEGFSAEIPEVMIERQIDRTVDDFGYRLAMQGMDLNAYLKMNQMELPSFRKLFADQSERQVKIRLALEKIAELEGLKVGLEEVEDEIKTLAEQNNMTVERVKELLSLRSLQGDLTVQKALELVKKNAKVVKPAAKKTTKKAKAEGEEAAEKKPAEKKTTKKATKSE